MYPTISLPDYCIASAEWVDLDLDHAPTFHITSTFPPTYVHSTISIYGVELLALPFVTQVTEYCDGDGG